MNLKHLTFNKIFLDKVDSTNSYLIELNTHHKLPNGTFVITNNQTDGKGQRGNEWRSGQGLNLTFSVILYPKINGDKSFYLNVIASLAVNKVLTDLKINSKIKWPNDILINNKKICGILVENTISGTKINQSIVGIGLNVAQIDFDDSINATSLLLENINVDKEDVFNQLYQYLDFYYDLLLKSNFDLLLKLYYKQMFIHNEFLDVKNNSPFKAKIVGVDDYGRLKLQKEDNFKILTYNLKEVKFIF